MLIATPLLHCYANLLLDAAHPERSAQSCAVGHIPGEIMPEGWNAEETDFGYVLLHRNFGAGY